MSLLERGRAAKKDLFDTVLATRNFEIGLFWQRSLFFWGFIAAAFVAYAEVTKEKTYNDLVAIGVACFGVICSIAWTLANRGSRYWQVTWERRLSEAEKDVLGRKVFGLKPRLPDDERLRIWGLWSRDWHFSVSGLAIALSDFTVGVWCVLLANVLPALPCMMNLSPWPEYAIAMATVAYAAFLFCGTWSKNDKPD